ncbi:alpha/beta hydrolase [Catellatospora sp. NPDC049609]|uniref:alpha/beta hydrolase family protein n=1 Tax=Catellatospora sp. NPDC049609 TaxID=3155505 RepID=UPI00344961CE
MRGRIAITAVGLLLVAGCAAPELEAAPAQPSVLRVELANGPDRPLPTEIRLPGGGGRHPLVVFVHGYTCHVAEYEDLLTHWARAGFAVAAPTFPYTHGGAAQLDVMDLLHQPADVTAVLDALLTRAAQPGDPLHDRLDPDRIVAGGHSLGGMTTVGALGRWRDPRLRAGIVLAGSARDVGTQFRGEPAPLLFVHGVADSVVTLDQGRAAYDAVPWPKAFLTLPQGTHRNPFMSTFDPDWARVAEATTDFLRWRLTGDAAARARLAALGTDFEDRLG